jgi:RES domain-containing protein
MSGTWRARDLELLDALDRLERIAVADTVWRVVRNGRDPLLCHRSGGRWDAGRFDVLYTAFHPDGAVSEMYFHLSRQPVFPSVAFTLNEIEVTTRNTLKFADLRELQEHGVDPAGYPDLLYQRTQEIGDAAAFLGFDGLIAPSARWDCLNLILFCDGLAADDLVLRSSSRIDWARWRDENAPV